jgi:hypothetical protein
MELTGARLVCLFSSVILLTSAGSAHSVQEVLGLAGALGVILVLAIGAEVRYRHVTA